MRQFALLSLVAGALGACASPTRNADALSDQYGFRKSIATGAGFRHVLYRNSAPATSGVLHVYIDGDGTPYAEPGRVAADPTPRNALMLRLMAEDPAASVYVGRPCYLGLQRDPGCTPAMWSSGRYSPAVLESMEAIVRDEITESGAGRVQMFGLSGGGVIAVLLAQRLAPVVRVVTVGANLDIDAWCDLHHYSRLVDSVNPAEMPPQRPTVEVLHLVGQFDTNTPPSLIEAAAARRGEPTRVVAHFDHVCCWEELWPKVLDDVH